MTRTIKVNVVLALVFVSGSALAQRVSNVSGAWNLNSNAEVSTMLIANYPTTGTCHKFSGDYNGDPIEGFYCPSTRRIQFLRKNRVSQKTHQIYTGNVGTSGAMGGTFTSQDQGEGGDLGEYNFSAQKR